MVYAAIILHNHQINLGKRQALICKTTLYRIYTLEIKWSIVLF